MRKFPSREAEIATLASEIVFGFKEHSDDFPSPPVGADELQAILEAYSRAHEATVVAQGAAAEATRDKDEVLEQLSDAMKGVSAYAEHAVKRDDAKLKNLGWVFLDWKSPATGDAVSAYRVLNRTSGETEWKETVLCFESMAVLTDQPQGVEVEYQVIAINMAGTSIPSNLVTAIL